MNHDSINNDSCCDVCIKITLLLNKKSTLQYHHCQLTVISTLGGRVIDASSLGYN